MEATTPQWLRIVNSFLEYFPKNHSRLYLKNSEKLIIQAQRQTGWLDFGDARFKEGYEVFVQSIYSEGNLSYLGNQIIKSVIFGYLLNRSHVQKTLCIQPEIRNISISRPVFIIGLSRTGTTLLHNLLTLATGARAPRTWEVIQPAPTCLPGSKEAKKRYQRTKHLLMMLNHAAPRLRTIHPFEANAVEECYPYINHTFTSPALAIHYGAKSYFDWLRTIDNDREKWIYREYKTVLQILQTGDLAARWVLKSSIHLYFLEALLQEIPDALIVQTHRDPVDTISSICSLVSCFRNLVQLNFNQQSLGVECLEFARVALERGHKARQKGIQKNFIDIHYAELVNDPIGQVQKIHAQFDLGWDTLYEIRMKNWLDNHPQGKHGLHLYHMSQFGLNENLIRSTLGKTYN